MTPRRQSAMGECERRTQGALIAALFVRPRTYYRAAQCVLRAGVSFFSSLLTSFHSLLALAAGMIAVVRVPFACDLGIELLDR